MPETITPQNNAASRRREVEFTRMCLCMYASKNTCGVRAARFVYIYIYAHTYTYVSKFQYRSTSAVVEHVVLLDCV